MLEALSLLGVKITRSRQDVVAVEGCNGSFPAKQAELFLGNAGTALRPLTAMLAMGGGHYKVSGVARMHERPIGDLVDALRSLGADIRYIGSEGYPPLEIRPATLQGGSKVRVRGDVSSQFLTALLMALPLAGRPIAIEVVGELISKPYIDITLNLMARFGVAIERDGWSSFWIPADSRVTSPGDVFVEGDASGASYFLAAGAIAGGRHRAIGATLARWRLVRALGHLLTNPAVEQTRDVHVTQHVDHRAAAIQKPVHGEQQGDVLGRELHRGEDQRHRHQPCFGNAGRAHRRDSGRPTTRRVRKLTQRFCIRE